MRRIAVVVGSARRDSLNRKLAAALEILGSDRFDFHDVRIDDFPFFDQDVAKNPPAAVLRMKKEIVDADGVIFVTPEHNRSITSLLKNAIDWGSRPMAESCWIGKPGAILGISPGQTGTAAAQQHLRNILSPQQMILMGQPEVYLQYKEGMFDAAGGVADEAVRKRLETFLERFAKWVERVAARGV
jgi:chromate reductase, NAD(P)H dehydrogenase (quinone)